MILLTLTNFFFKRWENSLFKKLFIEEVLGTVYDIRILVFITKTLNIINFLKILWILFLQVNSSMLLQETEVKSAHSLDEQDLGNGKGLRQLKGRIHDIHTMFYIFWQWLIMEMNGI